MINFRLEWMAAGLLLAACGGGGSGGANQEGSTGQPVGEVTTPVVVTSDQTIHLKWMPVSGASYYQVSRKMQSTGVSRSLEQAADWARVGTPKAPEFMDSGLSPASTYRYRIQACTQSCTEGVEQDAQTTDVSERPPAVASVPRLVRTESNEVELVWDAVEQASHYRLWRNGTTQLASGANLTQLRYIDDGVLPGHAYRYQVEACNSQGCAEKSAALTVNTPEVSPPPPDPTPDPVPSVPAAPTVAASESRALSLSWTAVAGAQRYTLLRDGRTLSSALTGSRYRDAGLQPATAYLYALQACNANGCSASSAETVGQTSAEVPAVPAPPSALVGGRSAVTLSWAEVAGASHYALFRNGSEVAGRLVQLNHTDSALAANTAYRYTLRACNAAGCSQASAETAVSTRSGDKLFIETRGLDASTGSTVPLNIYTMQANGQVFLDHRASTHQNGVRTHSLEIFGAGNYKIDLRGQPENQQQCSSSASGGYRYSGGRDVTVVIDCKTPARLAVSGDQAHIMLGAAPSMPQVFSVARVIDGAAVATRAIRYRSDNPAVATVGAQSGVVTPVALGQARIVATLPAELYDEGVEASYALTVVANSSHAVLERVEVGQNVMTEPGSRFQILAAGRQAEVRAYVYSNTPTNTTAPVVTLQVLGSAGQSVPYTMVCPNVLPSAPFAGVRYEDAELCRATVKAADVAPGMRLRVQIAGGATSYFSPAVMANNYMRVVLVPIIAQGRMPSMPTAEQARDQLQRAMPFARVDVTIREAAATNETGENLGPLLGMIDAFRRAEDPGALYYGMVEKKCWGTVGLGYIGGRSSVGISASCTPALSVTMVHEVGHNLSLLHAPGNGAGQLDPFWASTPPAWAGDFANGALSPAPLVNQLVGQLFRPTGYDVMAYRNGTWFSEFNHHKLASHVSGRSEFRPQAASMRSARASQGLMLVRGQIGVDGSYALEPVAALNAGQADPDQGTYRLHVYTRDGRLHAYAFEPRRVDHLDEMHFSVLMPAVANIANIEVLKDGVPLPRHPAARSLLARKGATAWRQSEPVRVEKSRRSLQLDWDAARYPYLTAAHVAPDGTRRILSLSATGGRLTLPGVFEGGVLELSLSDGLNGIMVRQQW